MKKFTKLFQHLFIPHEKNNYKAKMLHTDMLSFFLFGVLVAGYLIKFQFGGQVLGYATDITVDKLFQLTNEQRQKNNLTILTYNEQLAQAAAAKAADMFKNNYWAHYGPDGATPWAFILGSGYKYEYAGENLAKNFMFSDGVVTAWMDSQTHRENILRREYTDVGFAIVNGTLNGEETTLVVQMFGKPLNAPVITTENALPPQARNQGIEESAQDLITYQADTAPVVNEKPGILGSAFLPAYLNLNIIFISVIMLVLMIDLYVAIKMKYIRIGGKNVIHFLFLGFMIIALLILRTGAII